MPHLNEPGDSRAQKEHDRENRSRSKQVGEKDGKADKYLDGPNRPST